VKRVHTWLVHTSNLFVGGTGLVYGWMRYFAHSDDPFAVVNHPLEPQVQHLHVLAAPLLVFTGGLIWTGHIAEHYRAGSQRGRRTGIVLAAALFPMIVSGYALQVSVDDAWRTIWAWLHGGTSVAWILFAAVHPFLRAKRRLNPVVALDLPEAARREPPGS
jgi:hypothetical protein